MTDACISIRELAPADVELKGGQDVTRAACVVTLLPCLMLGLGVWQHWNQTSSAANSNHPILPAAEALQVVPLWRSPAVSSGKPAPVSSSEAVDDVQQATGSAVGGPDTENAKPAKNLVLPTTDGDQADTKAATENVLLPLKIQAVTQGLHIHDIPSWVPNVDIAEGKPPIDFPATIAVTAGDVKVTTLTPTSTEETTEAPTPLLIADVIDPSVADFLTTIPRRPSAGFADDDLITDQADQAESIEPVHIPLVVAIKPSINSQRGKPAAQVAPLPESSQAKKSTSPTDIALQVAPVDAKQNPQLTSPSNANTPAISKDTTPSVVSPSPRVTNSESNKTAQSPHIEPTKPAEPPVRITRQMATLRPRIDRVLQFYFDRPLNTGDDSGWSVMHSFLGYGVNTTLAVSSKTGRRVNAIGWMCWNNPCAGSRLLYLQDGYVTGREGPGYQGHPGQFLAMLAQVRLKRDYPLRVQGKSLSVEDLIEAEKRTCATNQELTFKLIGLSHYLESDAEWKNAQGETWNIAKMLQIELGQPVNGAACGGTHRIMACSYPVYKRVRRGEPIDGVFAKAKKYERDYQRYALTLQNRDGSFSSDWFKRRADWGDKDRQLQTTGHILEWLVFTLPRNELSDPRVVAATRFLANLMIKHRYHDWEVGPRGHALRALSLYQKRVFGTKSRSALAQRNSRRVTPKSGIIKTSTVGRPS